jgi:hypothetical protein
VYDNVNFVNVSRRERKNAYATRTESVPDIYAIHTKIQRRAGRRGARERRAVEVDPTSPPPGDRRRTRAPSV